MGITGFLFEGDTVPQKVDYNFLENAPCYSEYGPMTDILEVKEYEFVDMSENIDGMSGLMLELTSLPPVIAETPYNFVFGDINEQITFTFDEDEGAFIAGNMDIMSGNYDGTGKNYLIGIMGDLEEGWYQIAIYTTEPVGTYTAGLSDISENVPLILDGTYTFGSMGDWDNEYAYVVRIWVKS